jgi:hypothetical protein
VKQTAKPVSISTKIDIRGTGILPVSISTKIDISCETDSKACVYFNKNRYSWNRHPACVYFNKNRY